MDLALNGFAVRGHSLTSREGDNTLSSMTLSAVDLRSSASEPDEDLVSRLRAGERAAVAEAYDGHHEAVRRFARRLVGDDASAEDLVHETFVKLPTLMGKFRGESSLRSFLISVAANYARHHLRSAMRRRAMLTRVETERLHHGELAGSPDEEFERRRLARLLTLALDSLSLDHRVVFVLAEVEGRTSPEIAAILRIPEGTVRSRLLYAKKGLRTFLEKEEVR